MNYVNNLEMNHLYKEELYSHEKEKLGESFKTILKNMKKRL